VVEVVAGPRLRTVESRHQKGQPIEPQFADFPGNAQDWITIVTADAADDTYDEWFYLKGQRSGTLSFRGLAPGRYEARAYYDWPSGGYVVRGRLHIQVDP